MDYKRQHTLQWPAAIAMAIALTLAAYLMAKLFSSGGNTPLSSVTRLTVPANREVQVSGDYIYYLESGTLHCINSSGKYVWNTGVEMDSEFYATNHGVAVWNGKMLSLFDKDSGISMGSRQLDGEIISASVGDAYAAAVLGPEHDSTVKLLDRNGNDVDLLTGFSGLTIMDYDFFEGRDLFWLMTMDTGGSMPTCKISTYKPGKRETGVIEDMEQVLYQVMFRSSQIAVVGTNHLCMYDYHGKEIEKDRVTVYGYYMHAVDKSSDNPLMVFVPNRQAEGANGISDVRLIRANSESIIHLPVECKQLEAKGATLYGFADRYLVKNNFGEKTSKVYAFPVQVDTVIGITADRTAVVTSSGSIYLVRLP